MPFLRQHEGDTLLPLLLLLSHTRHVAAPHSRHHGRLLVNRLACAVQGIPARHRVWAWPRICGARAAQQAHMAQYYEAMVQRGESTSEYIHQIELACTPPRYWPDQACCRCLHPAAPALPTSTAAGANHWPATRGNGQPVHAYWAAC